MDSLDNNDTDNYQQSGNSNNHNKDKIEEFIHQNNNEENIRNLSNKIDKIYKNRMKDFNYTFFVKYADCLSDKIEFGIKLSFSYYNDNRVLEDIAFDLTIHQFYQLLNDCTKIETMIKTLI